MGKRDLRRLLVAGAMTLGSSTRRDGGSLAGQDAGAQAEDADRRGAGQPDGARIVWVLATRREAYRVSVVR